MSKRATYESDLEEAWEKIGELHTEVVALKAERDDLLSALKMIADAPNGYAQDYTRRALSHLLYVE